MSRIEGVQKPRGIFQRFIFWLVKRRFGRVIQPLRVMSLHPVVLSANAAYEQKLERASLLSHELKGLVEQRVAQLIGCPFCIDLSSSLNRGRGVSKERLLALSGWRKSTLFSAAERAALDYAEAMTVLPMTVTDAIYAELKRHFSEAQIVELTEYAALENKRSRFNHALGIGAEGFSDSSYCVLPDTANQAA